MSDTPKIPRFSKFTNPDDSYIVKIINLIKSENNKNNNINNNNTNDININNINTINHNNISNINHNNDDIKNVNNTFYHSEEGVKGSTSEPNSTSMMVKKNSDSSMSKRHSSEEEEEEGNRYIKDNIHSKINKILLPSLYRIAASTGDILGLNELLDGWPALINDADYHGKVLNNNTNI